MPNELTLKDLDQAFHQIWRNTAQMPALLDKWQQLVRDFLAKQTDDDSQIREFESYMSHWQSVLEENRALLEKHQKSLKSELETGTDNPLKAKKAKKYT
ncbi:hypothetical protein [Reinekea blandensis]|uniref:Uncharacterized protein n=1 Tax=Reinekea blandensis MED297 TaxID=314283 RepID=A4BEM5_9GAMM|nr:hypothetical protein [Reinekea blandensis]EAR09452.1 hypothetical protein MED297_02492 [Reinekea sp. MED297] [Reinekea blandensis MED297]